VLCLALLSHSILDWLEVWYTTPLGPPLKIDLHDVEASKGVFLC
jgi:membrane-bound metal-dependent hydrolase YbcI (DUF457 family)